MVNAATIVLCVGLLTVATCSVLAARRTPIILEVFETAADATVAASTANDTTASAPVADGAPESPGTDVVANNKIQIKDSQIVLTSRDRKQLIQTIANTLVAKAQDLQTASTDTSPLLHMDRDAYLYLTTNSTVRLGWRYPLTTWKIYRHYVFPGSCEVERVVGEYFYC